MMVCMSSWLYPGRVRRTGEWDGCCSLPGDLAAVRKKLMADNGRGNTIRDEHRLVCKDGNVKWISLKAQLMPGDDGILYFHGVFVDITDEKLAQRQIRELYEKNWPTLRRQLPREGSIQGRVNVTQDRVESYQSTDAAAIARTGHTYEQAIRKLADSAADSEYGGIPPHCTWKGTCVVRFCRRKNRSSF